MRHRRPFAAVLGLAALALGAIACGSDDDGAGQSSVDRPTVVVTTSILGDVVARMVGDHATVQVLMPRGADPHDVQISARQAAELRRADAVIVNGGGFEAGYLDAIEAAEADGVPVHAALDGVDTITFAQGHGHDHGDEGDGEGDDHAEEGEVEEDDHAEGEDDHAEEGEVDPHFFTDPDRMADAAEGVAAFLAREIPALATADVQAVMADEVAALRALAAEVEETLAAIPAERRVLVTNHEVFGYFADRFAFEVVGTVVPGGGTDAEPSAADLAELAHVIEEAGVPAVFADVSSPQRLADALAAEVGDVEVVALFTESLGEDGSGGATYPEMVRTNAERIATALA